MTWERAASLEELPDGTPHGIRIGTKAVVLVRHGDAVHAVEALCPHKFAPLAEGHLEDGCLVCPVHDGGFDLATGQPREGDGWAGSLRTFATRIEDGLVQVQL